MAEKWTYKFRILKRNPEQMSLDRLGDYMKEFAQLLGTENEPKFAGIRKASTGLLARVPEHKRRNVMFRLHAAQSQPSSKAARHLRNLEGMLGSDGLPQAEIRNSEDKVVYLVRADKPRASDVVTLQQRGEVEGTVTGLVGADDTMHLHLRDRLSRDLKLIVRDEGLARDLLRHFRVGSIRLSIHGHWQRTDCGWIPENNRCTVDSFVALEEVPLRDVLATISSAKGNGWCDLQDPLMAWRDLRGVN